jgi:hypothetical protein
MTIESPPRYASRLRTLNEIALPIVPAGTKSSDHADLNSLLLRDRVDHLRGATIAAFSWTGG